MLNRERMITDIVAVAVAEATGEGFQKLSDLRFSLRSLSLPDLTEHYGQKTGQSPPELPPVRSYLGRLAQV